MPKRVIDFDAMWASDKLAACAEWAQAEYAWFYGLADASGSFELTNLRVIWGRVAAVRKNLTLARLAEIFEEFMQRGLLFTWEQNGKRYGHWTGSDVPGRLPPPSWRMRLERLAPPVPRDKLAAYMACFGGGAATPGTENAASAPYQAEPAEESRQPIEPNPQLELKLGLEAAQAQEWELNWEKNKEVTQVCASSPENIESSTEPKIGPAEDAMADSREGSAMHGSEGAAGKTRGLPDKMMEIYEAERGGLPPAERLSEELRRQCLRRLAEGITMEDFREAVRRAAATPFLAGAGGRGWCASFDWLVANESNVRKVLAGRYDAPAAHARGWAARSGPPPRAPNRAAMAAGAHVGEGPLAAAVGARVKAATLERIRARDARLNMGNCKEKAS